jgi:2-desacetyl-2-hydroxyethyl bacteriochlorophyllide A dehydrogenase
MKSLVCTAPRQLEYRTLERPALSDGRAIIKIKRIGICGTDLHAFEGTQPYLEYPRILGHELSGELVEFDNAPGFKVGEKVTFIPYFNCGICIACRNGKPNCCVDIKVCGVHIDGGMVEYLSVPSGSLIHGNGLSLDELALVEPLAIGAHGIARAGIKKGEFVLIIGAGPIGLGTIAFAQVAGANVMVMDVNNARLDFSRQHLKVNNLINPAEGDAVEQLKAITDGDMPTVVIDATGNQKAINNAFQYMAHGGRFVLIGLQRGDIAFSHPEFHKREATLMSSRNATRADFVHVIDCMTSGLIDPETFITHRVNFDEIKRDFDSWLDPANGVIKAMVSMN